MGNLNDEILPQVDTHGNVLGPVSRSRCHSGEKILHPVVHLHIVKGDNQLLLQLRSKGKKIQPGKWDTAVGGHISYGESVDVALCREAYEETGLKDFVPEKITSYLFESQLERELINTFLTRVDDDFHPHCDETDIDELRFFTPEEIRRLISANLTTPNFAQEFTSVILPYINGHVQ